MKVRIPSLFRSVLPGIAMVGFTVGTGSVTAMAKAGADYGMSLLWALLLSCIVSFLLFTAFGRLSVVSGKGALEVIRSHIHPSLALFILLSIAIGVSASVMGVMGIVADVLSQWSLTWSAEGIPAVVWAAVLSLLIFVVLLSGSVRSVERLLAALAGVMGVCFLVNAVIISPSAAEVLSGFKLRIPGGDGSRPAGEGYLVAASIVGTTVAPVLFLFRSILIREEGWDAEKMAVQRRDAVVSSVLIFLISSAVMASAAGSLHADGITLDEAQDMITLLEPAAGTAAVLVFVIGIAAAGMSSQFPNVISIPWMRRDYQGRPVNLRDPVDRTMILLIAMLGLVVPIMHARPVWIMVISQALGAVVLPVTVLSVWYLLNNKKLMGSHVLGWGSNAALALVSLFSLVMASIGLYGILDQFRA